MSLPPLVHLVSTSKRHGRFHPRPRQWREMARIRPQRWRDGRAAPRRSTANSLNGPRVLGLSASIALHLLALALLLGAADPERPTALGESEVDALEIEFLQPAPGPVPVAPATGGAASRSWLTCRGSKPGRRPSPTSGCPCRKLCPNPVPTPPLVAAVTPQPPSAYAPASPPLPAPDRPLTARGKRAQSQYLRELMLWLARHRVYPAAAKETKARRDRAGAFRD